MSNVSKFSGLVDSRSQRGVFSRGKPVYRGGSNSPKPKRSTPIQRAAKRRLGQR